MDGTAVVEVIAEKDAIIASKTYVRKYVINLHVVSDVVDVAEISINHK